MNLYWVVILSLIFGGAIGWLGAMWSVARDPEIVRADSSMAVVRKDDLERLQLIARVMRRSPTLQFDESGHIKHSLGEEDDAEGA